MSFLRESTSADRTSSRDRLLNDARAGDQQRLGELLDSYRNYLSLIASTQIDRKLQARISTSDLVQETMLGAYRDFPQFRGENERQLLAWLRQILVHRLQAYVQQHVLAAKRDIRKEVALGDVRLALAQSTMQLQQGNLIADVGPSPSAVVMRREDAVKLADILAELPEEYRRVIMLRNLQGLSFDAVAEELGRSCGAARMLWLRAIKRLRIAVQTDTPRPDEDV